MLTKPHLSFACLPGATFEPRILGHIWASHFVLGHTLSHPNCYTHLDKATFERYISSLIATVRSKFFPDIFSFDFQCRLPTQAYLCLASPTFVSHTIWYLSSSTFRVPSRTNKTLAFEFLDISRPENSWVPHKFVSRVIHSGTTLVPYIASRPHLSLP